MAENYKSLYEQMKKMVELYQDELIPSMRKTLEELKQENAKLKEDLLPNMIDDGR